MSWRKATTPRKWVKNWNPDASWYAAHPVRVAAPVRRPAQGETISLIVSNEFFQATSQWRKIFNVWSCVESEHPLKWMLGKSREEVHLELLKMGCAFRWERPNSVGSARALPPDQSPACGTPPKSGDEVSARPGAGIDPDGRANAASGMNEIPEAPTKCEDSGSKSNSCVPIAGMVHGPRSLGAGHAVDGKA